MSRVVSVVWLGVAAALGVASCIDMTPLRDEPADAGRDGGAFVDPAVEFTCRVCMFGAESPCRPQWAACEADEKCRALSRCGIDRGCLTLISLEEQTVCALPCLEETGLKTNTDPAILLGLQVNVCKVTHCVEECGGSD